MLCKQRRGQEGCGCDVQDGVESQGSSLLGGIEDLSREQEGVEGRLSHADREL